MFLPPLPFSPLSLCTEPDQIYIKKRWISIMCLCSQRDIERFSSSSPLPPWLSSSRSPVPLSPSRFIHSASAGFADSAHFPACPPALPRIWMWSVLLANISDLRIKQLHILHPISFGIALRNICFCFNGKHTLKQIMLWLANNKVSASLHLFSTRNFIFGSVSKKGSTLKKRIMCSSQPRL